MTDARLHRPLSVPQHRPRRAASLGALALLGALLALLAGCGSQAGAWRLIGPTSGAHVFAIAADPHVAGLVYAGADNGGVYRARADQQGGIVSGAGIPSDAVVASLLPDAQRAGVVFAGTSDGLYRSSNYGNDWSAFGAGLPRDRAAVALAATSDGSTLLAGEDHGGLYRSVNAGATWAASASGLPALATPAALLWIAPAHVWLLGLVASSASPLYSSADDGQTWTPLVSGLPAGAQVNALALLNGASGAQPVLFAATTSGLYTSGDAGLRWSAVGGELPHGSALALATLPQQPAWLYVSVGSRVYRSTDGGTQWQEVAPGLTAQAQGLAVTQDTRSGPVVFVAAGQVARYPTGIPAGASFPTQLLLALVALALVGGGYVVMRRMRRFGYAMGAGRNEGNTGRAADAATRWGATQPQRAHSSVSSASTKGSGPTSGEAPVIAPPEPVTRATTGAPADTQKTAQNGHGKPKRRT